jgi:hypothetical protein
MACLLEQNRKCALRRDTLNPHTILGCDDNRQCYALDNGKPYDECEEYESDNVCDECQADLNTEKCECFNY